MSHCFNCGCDESCCCESVPVITTWTDTTGTSWEIQGMGEQWIKNCIKLIKRKSPFWRQEYLPVFEKELTRRKTKLYKALK